MKKRIFYIPIEPLEERYTAQWMRWFPQEFKKAGFEVVVIEGKSLTDKIETGEFLDINATLAYKASQLEKVGELFYKKEIKPNDIFFIADLEFWGIESIRYLSVLNKIPVKIYGFLHAGSYDREDFMAPCERFAKHFEEGWLEVCDKIFVGSVYHKNLILEKRYCSNPDKIIVTGNPWNTNEALKMVGKYKKKNQIVHSNLPDWRKRPNIFLNLVPIIKRRYPEAKIVLTTSRKRWGREDWLWLVAKELESRGMLEIKENLTKKEYYKILAESKVMFSATEQETFGYCIVEAMTFDTNPVVPNRLSCPEIVQFDKRLIYNNYTEGLNLIFERLEKPIKVRHYAEVYNKSIEKIIKEFEI
jgi:glycosyltransferase involved in cell wall biosynthesis